ncbi:phage repressor protein [Halolamina sp. CBA1230]|uniref:phage repressor protein n=1 Tax=Halolamina sp. CBA1230 TaxID=1853690 RepID=UPI0009A23CCE|nr:phage repressor protein [Halolamina sp. CBA1230]QKY19669.1 phage repressor protein [Halolamina sp. CBA1230]
MELSDTDWGILNLCSDNRETRKNIAAALDKSPNYISKELSKLNEMGLLQQPGPAENSGMHVTTKKAEFVLSKQEKYERRQSELFGEFVESAVELARELSAEADEEVTPRDIVVVTGQAHELLQRLENRSGISPQEAADRIEMNLYATQAVLYELYFFDLLDRAVTSEGEIYDLTARGRRLLDQPAQTTVKDANRTWNMITSKDRSEPSFDE